MTMKASNNEKYQSEIIWTRTFQKLHLFICLTIHELHEINVQVRQISIYFVKLSQISLKNEIVVHIEKLDSLVITKS